MCKDWKNSLCQEGYDELIRHIMSICTQACSLTRLQLNTIWPEIMLNSSSNMELSDLKRDFIKLPVMFLKSLVNLLCSSWSYLNKRLWKENMTCKFNRYLISITFYDDINIHLIQFIALISLVEKTVNKIVYCQRSSTVNIRCSDF